MRSLNRSIVAVAFCLGLGSCAPPAQQNAPQPQTGSQTVAEQRYDLKGKVLSIDKARKSVTVDHEAIPGFMGAMTMAYGVKDEHLLDTLSSGDQITAKVVVGSGGIWLEGIAQAPKELPTNLPR